MKKDYFGRMDSPVNGGNSGGLVVGEPLLAVGQPQGRFEDVTLGSLSKDPSKIPVFVVSEDLRKLLKKCGVEI